MNHWLAVGLDIIGVLKYIGPFIGSVVIYAEHTSEYNPARPYDTGVFPMFIGAVIYIVSVLAIAGII